MSLLAQVAPPDISRGLDNYLSARNPNLVWYAVAALTGILVLVLIWQITVVARARRGPRLLFYDLAALHGLPRRVQQRLLHLARAHRVADPAFLFVCPELVRRIESLEVANAASHRERDRLKDFFARFQDAAFGSSGGGADQSS